MERLFKKLVGFAIVHNKDEKIKVVEFNRYQAEFSKISSMFGKAFYLYFLEQHPDEKISAIAGKMAREIFSKEKNVYQRYIAPYIDEIKRLDFIANGKPKIMSLVLSNSMLGNTAELMILCRLLYNIDNNYLLQLISDKTAFNQNQWAEIEKTI